MSSQDKQVRISVGLDEQSFATAKRRISELTAEVTNLANASTKAGGLFGGGGPVSVGNATQQIGTSGRAQAQHRASASVGGVADSLTKAVQNSANLFKGAAAGSKDAFKIMSDGLKEHVRTSDQEITRLQTKLEGLTKTYDRLKSRAAGAGAGKLTDAAMGQAQGEYFQTADQLDRARTNRQKYVREQEKMEESANPTFYSRLKNYFADGNKDGGNAKKGLFGAAMGGAGLGSVATALASPAGAVAGGVMLGSKLMDMAKQNQVANLNYGIDSTMFRSDARASIGQIYGGNAQSIRHGDMARVAAMISLQKDPAFAAITGAGMSKSLKDRRILEATGGGLGGLAGYAAGKVGGLMSSATGGGSALGIGTTDKASLDYLRRTVAETPLQAQMMQKAIENKIAEDPGFSDRINGFYAGSTGNAGLLRSLGKGGGNIRIGGRGRGGADFEQSGWIKSQADAQLRDVGEFAAAAQELSGTAGRGFIGHFGSILGAKTGGLGNVASLLGVGAQFNGGSFGGASKFLKGIQGRIGRGGVDVTAAMGLTGLGTGMMTSGNFTGGGGGLMETLLSAGFTGSTGGDMRAAREVGMGVNALGNVMSGGVDPLQRALNASAAMKAGGGKAPYSALWAMQRSSPADLAEAQRAGVVPPSLVALGVTKNMLSTYFAAQQSTMFSRVDSSTMGGPAGAAMARYKASTSGLGYMKGWSQKRIAQEAQDLGSATWMAGGADSAGAGAGSIRFQLASAGILKGGKGHGAHDTIKRNTAMAQAGAAKGLLGAQEASKLADDAPLMTTAFQAAPSAQNAAEGTRKLALRGLQPGADTNSAIESVSAALMAFVSAIKRETGGMAPGGKVSAPRK